MPPLVLILILFLFSPGFITPRSLNAAEPIASTPEIQTELPETYTSSQREAILAGLSDEEVRKLLLDELKEKAVSDK